MQARTSPARSIGRRHLVVRTGSSRCAIELSLVRHVLRSVSVHRVPGSRQALLGLTQWGGEPLAVVDLRAELTQSPPVRSAQRVVVVVEIGADEPETLGLMVDEAVDVVRIPEEEISAEPQGLVRADIAVGSHIVRVLSLEALGADG